PLWGRGLVRGRIAIEERERDDQDRDDRAKGDERGAPTEGRDEPRVHGVEGKGAARVARAENAHGRPTRPYEPPGDDRGRGNDDRRDARGTEDAEADVVLRERRHLPRQRKGRP